MKGNKKPPTTIGGRIRELRIKNNMTQDDLASLLDIQRETISVWENDKEGHYISHDRLLKMSKHFVTSCDYILTGTHAKNITVSNSLGLDNKTIEVLLLSTEIIRRHESGEDWSKLAFERIEDNRKTSMVKSKQLNLRFAKNTLNCINLLLKESITERSSRVIDFITSYILANISEDDEIELFNKNKPEYENDTLLGSEVLEAKLAYIQEALRELRRKRQNNY